MEISLINIYRKSITIFFTSFLRYSLTVYSLTRYLLVWDAKSSTERKKNLMNETVQSQSDITNEIEPKSSNDRCVVTGIYGLRNTITNKWYVGQSIDIYKRWDKAYRRRHCKSQRKIYNALKKYGYESFDKVVIEECERVDWILDYREMYWIQYYNAIERGYNITNGGTPSTRFTTTGWKHSPETIARIKVLRMQRPSRPRSAETRQKIRMALIGLKRSDTTKRKCRAANVGKTLSDVHREKISAALKGRFTGTKNSHYTYRTP